MYDVQLNTKLDGTVYTVNHTPGHIEIKYTGDFYNKKTEVIINFIGMPIQDAYLLRIKEIISDYIISDEAKLR